MTMTDAPIGSAAAAFIAANRYREYAPEVVEAAKRALVDWCGVALGAVNEPAAQAVARTAARWNAPGDARVLLGPTMAPALAALVNGTMSHCMDYDDSHKNGGGHVSGPTWATALAMTGHLHLSETEALGGFITGFEVQGRLGGNNVNNALQFRGFHPTSLLGKFGAAATAAAIMGLDQEMAAHALGLAATMAGGLNGSFGTMSKPFHTGKAAMDGILAAQLAAEDFEAATHLLDADSGFYGTFIQDRETRVNATEFSEGWEVTQNAFKPYACCKGTHASIDAARQLTAQVAGQTIRRVHLRVNPRAKLIASIPHPTTPLQAKFSIGYCTALALLGYPAVYTDFSEDRFKDERIWDILRVVEVESDPKVERVGAFLTLELADGRTLTAETQVALGNPDNPMSWEHLETKFMGLVEPILQERAGRLLGILRRFEKPGSLQEMMEIVGTP